MISLTLLTVVRRDFLNLTALNLTATEASATAIATRIRHPLHSTLATTFSAVTISLMSMLSETAMPAR